ncbi:Uncharacterised protein [Mycobacterium tuberculosis]|nr:Uncharacterised protein [Mycobacterium tuberculosis]
MVWFLPVKASTMNQENLFLLQEIKDKLLIIIDTVHIAVDFWEDIEPRLGFNGRQTWNILNGIIDEISLLVDSSTRKKQFID